MKQDDHEPWFQYLHLFNKELSQLKYSSTQPEQKITLSHIHQLLTELIVTNIQNSNQFIRQVLRPTAFEILESKWRDQDMRVILKNSLILIIKRLMEMHLLFESEDVYKLLEELIKKNSFLYNKPASASPSRYSPSSDPFDRGFDTKIQKTQFHQECCELISGELAKNVKIVWKIKLSIITDLLKFLFILKNYTNVLPTAEAYVVEIEALFKSGRDELITFCDKQKLGHMVSLFTDLTKSNPQLCKRAMILQCILSISLLKCQKLQNKIQGTRLLNKFSREIYHRSTKFFHQDQFQQWLLNNSIFQMLFHANAHVEVLKNSEEILKTYSRAKNIGPERLNVLINLLKLPAFSEIKKFCYKILEPYRLQSDERAILIDFFLKINEGQYYDEDLLNLLEDTSRFADDKKQIELFTYCEKMITDQYQVLKTDFMKSRFVEVTCKLLNTIVEDVYKNYEQRLGFYCKFYEKFIMNPKEGLMKLILKMTGESSSFGYINLTSSDKIYENLIEKKLILERFMEMSVPGHQLTLTKIIKNILKRYKRSIRDSTYIAELLIKCVKNLDIFQELLESLPYSKKTDFFKKINTLAKTSSAIPFQVLRKTFIKLNERNITYILNENKNRTDLFEVDVLPPQLEQFDQILANFKDTKDFLIRKHYAKFIVQLYTSNNSRLKDKIHYFNQLQEVMNHHIEKVSTYIQPEIIELEEESKNNHEMKIALALIYEFMRATQYFGLGSLRSHISLVATSTCSLKIFNNVTFGDDVAKVFSKSFPSNYTLFEVMTQIGLQFKCGPEEMQLKAGQYPYFLRNNGETLQELQLHEGELIACKNYNNKLQQQSLIFAGELTVQAIKCLSDIFNKFAYEGKMSLIECTQYFKQSTKTEFTSRDYRVRHLFEQYDTDHDDILTVEDFIRYYHKNLTKWSNYKDQEYYNSIYNCRYRKNLTKYDQPIDMTTAQKYMLRTLVSNNILFYDVLFALTSNSDPELEKQSKQILIHLPTSPRVIKELQEHITILDKSLFKIEYMLIAIQSQLNKKAESDELYYITKTKRIQNFIKYQNDKQIFELLQIYSTNKQSIDSTQKKCLSLCLQILRSLINIDNLNNFIMGQSYFSQQHLPKLPESDLFSFLTTDALAKNDVANYEPLLVLQLAQKQVNFKELLQGVFSEFKEIRTITCNFLYCWQIKTNYDANLYQIQFEEDRSSEWLNLLSELIKVDTRVDVTKIFVEKIKQLETRSQNLDGKNFDSVMYGYLNIMNSILQANKINHINLLKGFEKVLKVLIQNTISSQNRKLLCKILGDINIFALLDYYMLMLTTIRPNKQCRVKQKFLGIKNLGSICYMNSVLQQFYMVNDFRKLVLSHKTQEDYKKIEINGKSIVDDFFFQLQKMFSFLTKSQKQHYNPYHLCLSIKDLEGKPINTSIQEDANQFLINAFAKIQQQLKHTDQVKQLQKIFGGKTIMEITCKNCNNKIERKEGFYNLALEVKGVDNLWEGLKKLTSAQCIDDYKCQACNNKVKTEKRTMIYETPEVLIINLQRIIFDMTKFDKTKVHSRLEFPMDLDLREFTLNQDVDKIQTNYALKGVVIHTGNSDGGHYYSIIKTHQGWYKFNDQSVTPFDINDLQRESFGGNQNQDSKQDVEIAWTDSEFSTNAYMLFYEKTKSQSKIVEEELTVKNDFTAQIQNENSDFFKEIQVHQQSFFDSLNDHYKHMRPKDLDARINSNEPFFEDWQKLEQIQLLEKYYEIYVEACKFLVIFSQISRETVFQCYRNLYEILHMLPQKTYIYLHNLNILTVLDVICTHSELMIRDGQRMLLNKAMNVYSKYYGFLLSKDDPDNNKIVAMLDVIAGVAQTEMIHSNTFKCMQYFELIRTFIAYDPALLDFFLHRQYYGTLLDILMGKDSPYFKEHPKIQQIPNNCILPILQTLPYLITRKTNAKGYTNNPQPHNQYFQLTQKERNILFSPTFYKKIIKNKRDSELLTSIYFEMSFKDIDYSILFADFLINQLNNKEQVENAVAFTSHLRFFILIQDEFQMLRLNWILGVPQLLTFQDDHFGLRSSYQSDYVKYCSGLIFSFDHNKSLLQVVYDERKNVNSFTSNLVMLLLELVQIQVHYKYIIEMIPPSKQLLTALDYCYRLYLDWIPEYIEEAMKSSFFTTMPLETRNACIDKMTQLYSLYIKKVEDREENIPKQKEIIGKNYTMSLRETFENEHYKLILREHQTFVLDNLPTGNANNSMPKDLFKSFDPRSFALCFVNYSRISGMSEGKKLDRRLTMITMKVQCNKTLQIQFKLPNFNYAIRVNKGNTRINFPFIDLPLQKILDVAIINEKFIGEAVMIGGTAMIEESKNNSVNGRMDQEKMGVGGSGEPTIECGKCTFANHPSRERCQICDEQLYS